MSSSCATTSIETENCVVLPPPALPVSRHTDSQSLLDSISTLSVNVSLHAVLQSTTHNGTLKGIYPAFLLVDVPGVGSVRILGSEWHRDLFNPFFLILGDPVCVTVSNHKLSEFPFSYGHNPLLDPKHTNELVDHTTRWGVVVDINKSFMEATVEVIEKEKVSKVCTIDGRLLAFLDGSGLTVGDTVEFKTARGSDLVVWVSRRVERSFVLDPKNRPVEFFENPRTLFVPAGTVQLFKEMHDRYMKLVFESERRVKAACYQTQIDCWKHQGSVCAYQKFACRRATTDEYVNDRADIAGDILVTMVALLLLDKTVSLERVHEAGGEFLTGFVAEIHGQTGVDVAIIAGRVQSAVVAIEEFRKSQAVIATTTECKQDS